MDLQLKWVKHNSADYWKSVELRDLVLRQPLNMVFTDEQLEAEKDEYHLIGLLDKDVIACLVLKPKNKNEIQMRQVAVHPGHQKKGIGSELVANSEKKATQLGFKKMFLHARDLAIPFYQNLHYLTEGEEFFEVGIPHMAMYKWL